MESYFIINYCGKLLGPYEIKSVVIDRVVKEKNCKSFNMNH